MKGPISSSSRTAHHTLTLKRSWKLLATVAWGFSSAHTRVVCIIDTVVIELRFVSKQDVMMQMVTAIEPLAKFQPLSKIARSETLHSLHVVWIHALCIQCSPLSRVGNMKTSCNSSHTCTWTALYHLINVFFFIDAFINITLGCNANTGRCTGILQCLVNSSKHSSGSLGGTRIFGLVFYGSENVADIQLRHELNYRHKNRTHKSYLHTLQLKM